MLFSEIKKILNIRFATEGEDIDIQELVIDSRKITNPSHAVFIALKGNSRNGHDFIKVAYQKGIRKFIVQDLMDMDSFPQAAFLYVPNTLEALQAIGKRNRTHFHYPVIGITGSNGKTIVKEWLYTLLSNIPPFDANAGPVRSPKSFNSQIGVPLSVWLMQKENTIGIFEAGISQPGEMKKNADIIQPQIGIFTNIGEAHAEGFLNIEEKVDEKLKLFANADTLVFCKDYSVIKNGVKSLQAQRKDHPLHCFTWSYKEDADLKIITLELLENKTEIKALLHNKQEVSITIPFTDKAYIENAIHCWATLLFLNIDTETISDAMPYLHPVAMRLELVAGINNCTLINDSYNSDLTSLRIALDFLNQQKQHLKKTVILSDILQVEENHEKFYKKVADLLHHNNIQRLIGIGPRMLAYKNIFEKYDTIAEQLFFADTTAFLSNISTLSFSNETILLKGARRFEFEKIEHLLAQKRHTTVMEVDLSAIQYNLKVYKKMLQPHVRVMAMVKAFSYGSGSFEIANLLQYEGVDYLGVAYLDEGIALRKAGITLPIMVMSPHSDSYDQMIAWKIEPEIFSIKSLKDFMEIAAMKDTVSYPIHLKLDTGMHRLGFNSEDIPALIEIIKDTKTIEIRSIFSHLAASDDTNLDAYTFTQATLFKSMSEKIMATLAYRPLLHLSNTSAISRFPNFQFDMVRLGIGLYGIDSDEKLSKKLQNVGTLYTRVAQVRSLKAGETVGYSRKGILKKDSIIATVSIGYADGYFRDFGNGECYMLVNEKKAATIGSICMDMCMLDITDIPNVKAGDKVVVFGKDLSVKHLATIANTIPYEIMTSISQRVKRVYINE